MKRGWVDVVGILWIQSSRDVKLLIFTQPNYSHAKPKAGTGNVQLKQLLQVLFSLGCPAEVPLKPRNNNKLLLIISNKNHLCGTTDFLEG